MAKGNNKRNDSFGRTLTVVVILCLVCSVIVAGSAVLLKPLQEQQKQLDKQRNILAVANLGEGKLDQEQIQRLFDEQIEARLLDLQSGEFVAGDAAAFDPAQAAKNPATSIALTPEQDRAGIQRRSNLVEVYLVKDRQGKTSQVVLPVYGSGLWSMMYALVSVDTDGNTIKGLTFYEHGETPGLGGEIENPTWLEKWSGKRLFNEQGKPAIHVVKGSANPNDPHAIDGLSGATLTANGVQHTFDFWMGENGYGPFLKRVREGALNNG